MAPDPYLPVRQLGAVIAAHRQEKGAFARVAFVLAPGGAAGAHQAGALQALAEHGVRPDLVVGTSSGALNALGVVLDALAPLAGGAWPTGRPGRIWRQMGRPGVGAGLVVDKPHLLGWLGGKPKSGLGLAGELLGQLPHLGAACAAVQDGLFRPEPLRALLAAAIARAVSGPDTTPETAGHARVDDLAAAHVLEQAPPAVIILATDVQSHEATPFVLGDVALGERLFARRHPVRALGHGTLTGAAVLDAFLASAAIPGAFPAISLPAAQAGWPPRRYIDGAVAASEPFHLAIDAGATLIVSLEVAPYAHPPRPSAAAGRHPLATAADALMAIQERYIRADARGVSLWNHQDARHQADGHRLIPFFRLAPSRQALGLLDFDGRYEGGQLRCSLFDWFMEGYGDAGGDEPTAWASYMRLQRRHGDTGLMVGRQAGPGFWDATYRPAPGAAPAALTAESAGSAAR